MDYIEKIRTSRIINYFNFNCPISEDETKGTDSSIVKAIHTFINRYDTQIKLNYTFIIKYDNDALSYMTYLIIKNVGSILGRDLDIRYCYDKISNEEKELFKNIKPIGFKKAKNLKRAVLITSYHPICNVEADKYFSKFFIEIYHPLEIFTPNQLSVLQDFYCKKDMKFYCENLGKKNEEEIYWNKYFTYPIEENNNEIFDRRHLSILKNKVPVVIFKLSGTEEDFPLYDFILKSSKEGNIHLYYINGDKNFVITNLSRYLDYRNTIQNFNTLTKVEYEYLINQYFIYNYTYENFQEGED